MGSNACVKLAYTRKGLWWIDFKKETKKRIPHHHHRSIYKCKTLAPAFEYHGFEIISVSHVTFISDLKATGDPFFLVWLFGHYPHNNWTVGFQKRRWIDINSIFSQKFMGLGFTSSKPWSNDQRWSSSDVKKFVYLPLTIKIIIISSLSFSAPAFKF